LEKAIALMPKNAAAHSNLGLALCQSGQIKQGVQEIDTALNLDWSLLRARFLKGAILLDQDARDKEAWDNLQAAQREVPTAHLALALYYERHGQGGAADQQLRDYAELDRGVTLAQARKWLNVVAEHMPATQALGLWSGSTALAGE
jgi:Tfp pilus assembly protein PilF